MRPWSMVVADGGRARWFTVEWKKGEGEPVPRLFEQEAMTNPEAALRGQELWANTKSGRNRAPYGPAHGYDDHREGNRDQKIQRFARDVVAATLDHVEQYHPLQLVLVAEPHMLGRIREPIAAGLPADCRLTEVAEDLSWHALTQIQNVLVRHGVLRAGVVPASVR